MSKGGGWVPIDKGAIKTLGNLGRPYSVVEALVSHTVDVDCGKPWTINGYAKIWEWSRGKVRRFVNSLRTHNGHIADRKGTQSGHPVHFIDKGLWDEADTKRTHSGHIADSKRDTTSNPNTKPNPKTKTKAAFSVPEWVDKKLWTDFLKMRIKLKKPVTSQRAVTGIINKLKSLIDQGYSQDQIIGEALEKCWQTFYEPKNQQKEPEDDYVWGKGVKDDGKISTDGAGSTASKRINKPRFAT